MKLMVILIAAASLGAQSVPNIAAIVSGGSFRTYGSISGQALAAHGLATIFGSNLSDAEYRAGGLPWPVSLGKTSVFICDPKETACTALALTYAAPGQLNFLLPDGPLETGRIIFVRFASGGVNLHSNNYAVSLKAYVPDIFWVGYDCLVHLRFQNRDPNCGLSTQRSDKQQADRGAVTDLNGVVVSSSNRAKLGGYYTIWLTGLGLFQNGKPPYQVQMLLTNVPVYGYPGDTWMYGDPLFVGPSPQFPGLYQINFQLPISMATSLPEWQGYPPAWPCGNYEWEVSLDIGQGQESAELVQIPISVRVGDVPCK